MSVVLHSQIQPIVNHVVLKYLLIEKKMSAYKWAHTVQTHLIQESDV